MTREISRQAFVHGALGVAAGALLGSCRTTDAAIEGRVVLPASAEYAAAKNLFNARFDTSTPAAVKSINDVQKAVAFAAKNSIKIAARSGGHSYIGASAANSAMVIDLRQLPGGITSDDRGLATVRLQHSWIRCRRHWPHRADRSRQEAAQPSASPV